MTTTSAPPAHAHGDPSSGYQGDVKGVQVETGRDYNGTNTTFTFTLKLNEGENQVSHVLLMSCPGVTIVGATGPDDPGATPKPTSTAPSDDGSIKDSPHNGIKFDPGYRGVHTITFAGNIAAAQFVVKDGTGHQHVTAGDEANLCQTVTQQTPSTPPAENPPANNTPPENPTTNNPPANNQPSNNPASNQPGQSGTQVAGNTQTKPGSDVLGDQLTAPEAQAALPRTGLPVPALASIGTMLLALGGVATALGSRPRG